MIRRVTLALVLATLAACGGDDPTATAKPGVLTLTLSGAGGNDGALVVTVSGGPINDVHGVDGVELSRNTDASGTHLLLLGNITEGIVARLDVPDVSKAAAYVATVDQAADRTTFGLLDAASYRLVVAKVP